jgi:hypothetical protein
MIDAHTSACMHTHSYSHVVLTSHLILFQCANLTRAVLDGANLEHATVTNTCEFVLLARLTTFCYYQRVDVFPYLITRAIPQQGCVLIDSIVLIVLIAHSLIPSSHRPYCALIDSIISSFSLRTH